ncbi:MAG: hypothetical protein Q8R15_01340 [Candidatus Micrarchaeota archaeon]|nr:hypothetical protein [Candidatus Micrarchaeota archaeon]
MLMHRLVISHDDFQASLHGNAEATEGEAPHAAISKVFSREARSATLSKLVLKEDENESNTLKIEHIESDKGKSFTLSRQRRNIVIEAKPGEYLRLTPSSAQVLRRTLERHEYALKQRRRK